MSRAEAEREAPLPAPRATAPATPRIGGRVLPGHSPREEATVLVVEGDQNARELLRRVLDRHGLEVLESSDAGGALRQLFDGRPDLVILDLQLPGLDGRGLLGRIREISDLPVIVVTADASEETCVSTLRSGADDFMPKPFGVQELLARVEALLRRRPAPAEQPSRYADDLLEIDYGALEVRAAGRIVQLTPLQLRLLTALVHHRDQVLSAEQLLGLAWDDDMVPRERVKLYVGYLRRSFKNEGIDLPVETVRGFGYRYRPPSSQAG